MGLAVRRVPNETDMNVGARGTSFNTRVGPYERHKRQKHSRDRSKLVRMNVSGREFFIYESDLNLYPETLLGSSERECYFQPALNCYFFDRNRVVFEYIASFYQTGALNLPTELDSRLINDELTFFKLNDEEADEEESVKSIPTSLKGRMHMFLNYPSYSIESGIWAGIDMFMILAGILLYCLETEPSLKQHFTDPADSYYDMLWWVQTAITLFFTIDLSLRAATWPDFAAFFKEPINILDFISIIPFYIQYLLDAMNVGESGVLISIGRLFRMIRVIRVVKFFRYFQEMFLIIQFIAHAWKEIVLIICLTSMLLVIFGSILYNVENEVNGKQFYSIAQGFWWSLTTITTVGYGDIYPISWLGQLFGSILVIFSLVVLTLPMTIIITKFNYAYEVKKRTYKRSRLSPTEPIETPDSNSSNSLDFMSSIGEEEGWGSGRPNTHTRDNITSVTPATT